MGNKTRHTANLVSDNNIFVDIASDRVGIGSTQPTAKLNIAGIVSATSFRGDGSQLSGISVDSSSLVDSNSATRVQANTSGAVVTGILTATKFFGDASNVTGIVTTNLGKANVTIGDNPPGIGTAHGDLWWESDTAKGHIYYNDGSSSQWVEFSPSSGGGGGGGGTSGISSVGIQSGGVFVGSASTINFDTTGLVSVSNDIATVSIGSSIRFVGARIYHDNFSPTSSGGWATVTNWDGTTIDTHSFVNASNGFTIPAGVSKVRITFGGRPSSVVSNQWTVVKNGSFLQINDGGIFVEAEGGGYSNGSVTGTTAVLSVTQGDTFILRHYVSSTTPTWDLFFEIEVIEGDILGDYFSGSSYTDANVDAHLNVSSASSGQILSWNGSDYAWVADQTGGGGGGGGDAATLDTLDSTQFLRSDAQDEKTAGDLTFNDSVKLNLGTHGDMSIFFNGSHTFMDSSVGNINIRTVAPSGGDVIIGSGTSDYFRADSSTGESILYHYSNQKLATKSDGIDVTGHTETDTLRVSGVSTFTGTINASSATLTGNLNIPASGTIQRNGITWIQAGSDVTHYAGSPGSSGGDTIFKSYFHSISGSAEILRIGYGNGGNGAISIPNGTLSVGGISTFSSDVNVGSGVTVEPNGQATFTGIVTASAFSGDGSGLTNVGAGSTNLVTTWTLGANGSSDYTFTGPGVAAGAQDPTIYLVRGQTYKFENRSGGHPFRIQYEFQNTGGTAYNDGIVNNAAGNGTDLYWEVRNDAPDLLHYQCTSHGGMSGRIVILGDVVSSGSWTASAGTAQTIDTITGVANNAIKTAEYTIHIENGSNMQAQKVLVMQDGTTAFSQEYAIMHKSGLLVSMSATISGGNLLLQATPETGVSGTTTYKITRQTMR